MKKCCGGCCECSGSVCSINAWGSRWWHTRARDAMKGKHRPHLSYRRFRCCGTNEGFAYVVSFGSIFKGSFGPALSSQVLDAINENLVKATKSMGDVAAMRKVPFPNGPPLVGQFGLIAEMELPDITLTRRDIDQVSRTYRQIQSAAMGKANGWQWWRRQPGAVLPTPIRQSLDRTDACAP